MTTKAAPSKTPPRAASGAGQRVTSHMLGCFPGCSCRCGGAFCACREGRRIPTEPSAEQRAQGARVTVREAA